MRLFKRMLVCRVSLRVYKSVARNGYIDRGGSLLVIQLLSHLAVHAFIIQIYQAEAIFYPKIYFILFFCTDYLVQLIVVQ